MNRHSNNNDDDDDDSRTRCEQLLVELCRAVDDDKDSARVVARLLGHLKRPSLSWRAPLWQPRNGAADALQVLWSAHQDDDDNSNKRHFADNICAEKVVKALLISPSAYETPWKTACQLVRSWSNQQSCNATSQLSSSSATTCSTICRSMLLEVQTFLQQAVAAWWEQERRMTSSSVVQTTTTTTTITTVVPKGERLADSTPRQCMLDLLEAAAAPLIQNDGDDHNNNKEASSSTAPTTTTAKPQQQQATNDNNKECAVPLQLIPLLVSVAKDLEEDDDDAVTLLDEMLDRLFQKQPAGSNSNIINLVLWVHVMAELRFWLRPQDWSSCHLTIQHAFLSSPVPDTFLPELAESLFALCRTLLLSNSNNNNNNEVLLSSYQGLLLQLYSAGGGDPATKITTTWESRLRTQLAAVPSRALSQWMRVLATTTTTTTIDDKEEEEAKWPRACLLLLSWRTSRVSHLVARALTDRREDDDDDADVWSQLVALMGYPRLVHEDHDDWHTSSSSSSRCCCSDWRYVGRGVFFQRAQENNNEATATQVGRLVYQSLALGGENDDEKWKGLAGERAQAWMDGATRVLGSSNKNNAKMLAMVVLIVVYLEIPASRSGLEQQILQAFDGGGGGDLAAVTQWYCLVISVVVRSVKEGDSVLQTNLVSVLAKPMPLELFREAVDALLPIDSARRLILSVAQKSLKRSGENALGLTGLNQCSSFWSTWGDDNPIQCALYGLTVLFCVSERWDETAEAAWLELSTVVADCAGPVSMRMRRWLLDDLLRERVKNRRVSSVASQHLLRCCVLRLLGFVGTNRRGRWMFLPRSPLAYKQDRLVEDLACLFGLVLDLVHCGIEDELIDGVKKTAVAWHQYCQELLDASPVKRRVPVDVSTDSEFLKLQDDQRLPFTVALCCLPIALETLTSTTTGKPMASPKEALNDMLVAQEIRELRFSQESLPAWLRRSTSLRQPSDQSFDWHVESSLYYSVADLLVEFFVSPRWPWSMPSTARLQGNGTSAFLTTILSIKRKLPERNTALATSLVHQEAMMAAYTGLISDLVPTVRQSLSGCIALDQMDGLLSVVMDACDFTSASCQEAGAWGLHRACLSALHRLYECLCSESSVKQLISFLEKNCRFNKTSFSFAKSDSLRSAADICNQDDVDIYVRSVRLSVLRAVSTATVVALEIAQKPKEAVASNGDAEESSALSGDSLLQILYSFCQDVREGIEGESGGLASDLFHCYLDCIDRTAELIKFCGTTLPFSTCCSAPSLDLIRQAAKALEEVFVVALLKRASSFKQLLTVAMQTLPSLARSIVRARSSNGSKENDSLFGSRSFSMRLFFACTDILKQKSNGSEIAWRQTSSFSCSSDLEGDDRSETSDSNALRVAAIGSGEMDLISVVLESEKTWNWAICSALQAFDDSFADGLAFTQRTNPSRPLSLADSQGFVRGRKVEIAGCIRELCRPLKKRQVQRAEASSERKKARKVTTDRVEVMSLPPTAKARYISTLDRLLAMLCQSTKKLGEMIAAPPSTTANNKGHSGALLGTLAVVLSWLSEDTSSGVEVTAGVRVWHSAEREDLERRRKGGTHAAEGTVVKRLRKLEQRVDELETILRRLGRSLHETKSNGSLLDIVKSVEAITGTPLQRIVTKKLKLLDRQHSSSLEGGSGVMKRKVTDGWEKRAQRERKRQTIRSRNRVVDKWLQLDRSMEEETRRNDAFADLEDFLVDG